MIVLGGPVIVLGGPVPGTMGVGLSPATVMMVVVLGIAVTVLAVAAVLALVTTSEIEGF